MRRWLSIGGLAAAGLAASVAIGACGSSGSATLSAPPTTQVTIPTSPTVPPLGAPVGVATPTPANATVNAQGACSRFNLLYIRVAEGIVPSATALSELEPARQFAAAAATALPEQWGQLRADIDALAAAAQGSLWAAGAQIDLPAVQTVYNDCRSLQ